MRKPPRHSSNTKNRKSVLSQQSLSLNTFCCLCRSAYFDSSFSLFCLNQNYISPIYQKNCNSKQVMLRNMQKHNQTENWSEMISECNCKTNETSEWWNVRPRGRLTLLYLVESRMALSHLWFRYSVLRDCKDAQACSGFSWWPTWWPDLVHYVHVHFDCDIHETGCRFRKSQFLVWIIFSQNNNILLCFSLKNKMIICFECNKKKIQKSRKG